MSADRPPPTRVRKVVDWVVGLTLIAIGIAFGFLPVLQGWLFILAGLAVLSSHSRFARSILDRFKGVGRKIRHGVRRRREARQDPDGPEP